MFIAAWNEKSKAFRAAFVTLQWAYVIVVLTAFTSALLGIGQALGWHPVRQLYVYPPGFFYNQLVQGEVLALAIIICLMYRYWIFIPIMLVALLLTHSRGAVVALAFGILAYYVRKPLILLVVVLALALFFTIDPSPSDIRRLQIWHAAWTHLTFYGHGWGSFDNLWMGSPAWHPEYVHNDYLQLVFEFGFQSVVIFFVLFYAALQTKSDSWPLLITFLFMATYSMPMHAPFVALIGLLALAQTIGPTRCVHFA